MASYRCSFDVAPRQRFQPIFESIYEVVKGPQDTRRSVDPQQLALLYAILAMGTLHHLELPPDDPSAEEYLELVKKCLSKGDFLQYTKIESIQTLVSVS